MGYIIYSTTTKSRHNIQKSNSLLLFYFVSFTFVLYSFYPKYSCNAFTSTKSSCHSSKLMMSSSSVNFGTTSTQNVVGFDDSFLSKFKIASEERSKLVKKPTTTLKNDSSENLAISPTNDNIALNLPYNHEIMPSGQDQLPTLTRLSKTIHEESLPWTVAIMLPSLVSLIMRSSIPLQLSFYTEMLFFVSCSMKLLFHFNTPKTPEPLIKRKWRDVVNSVWSSQPDISARRKFIMGWFYDEDFDRLCKEDAITYLTWMKYGVAIETNVLSQQQVLDIEKFDLVELEKNINYGNPLPSRSPGDKPLPCIRMNLEPLRFRHKPLVFYGVTHGAFMILKSVLRMNNFVYVPAKDSKKDLSYWYKTSTNIRVGERGTSRPLVFVHGVGGMAFYYQLIRDLTESIEKSNGTIMLIDLPHVSLRIHNHIPDIASQVDSVCNMLDSVTGGQKATFVGHSYGSTLLSWMVQSKPERVQATVFLDPICFQLHLKDILFNFHMQRVDKRIQEGKSWDNPFSIGSLVNLAGTEMHTNFAMLRQFSWANNSLWPHELSESGIPSLILLSEKDEIVPTLAVERMFNDFLAKTPEGEVDIKVRDKKIVRCHVFKGATHGEIFLNDANREVTVNAIMDMIEKTQDVTEASESNANIFRIAEGIWDQIKLTRNEVVNALYNY